jgi:hypothetical protein
MPHIEVLPNQIISGPTLDGLVLRLESDLGITLSGMDVQTWADQSGEGNDASAPAAINRLEYVTGALNGKPVLRGDGINKFLSLTGMTNPASNYTFFFVASDKSVNPGDADSYLFDIETGRLLFRSDNIAGNRGISYFDGSNHDSGVVLGTSHSIITYILDSGGANVYKNGTNILSSSYTQRAIGGRVTLAARFDGTATIVPFDGDMAAVIANNIALTSSQVNQTWSYLSYKFGITTLLL